MDEIKNALISLQKKPQLPEDLLRVLHQAGEKLGFDFCSYYLLFPLPISKPKLRIYGNLPEVWQTYYCEHELYRIDPILLHFTHSVLPLIWDEPLDECHSELQHPVRQYGCAQACRNTQGVTGILVFSNTNKTTPRVSRLKLIQELCWLADYAFEYMVHFLPEFLPELFIKLSAREVEVLGWSAEGKTSSETAQIMSISERTINFHIGNAVIKLGVTNKTAAVVKASILKLL